MTTVENIELDPSLMTLYRFLVDRGAIEAIKDYRADILHIFSRDVLRLIRDGDAAWEKMVPDAVAAMIRSRSLFGYRRPESGEPPPARSR